MEDTLKKELDVIVKDINTMIDEGSRFVPLQLGQNQLAASYLTASSQPWNIKERSISDRDRLGFDFSL